MTDAGDPRDEAVAGGDGGDEASLQGDRMHWLRPEDAPAVDFHTPTERRQTDGREAPADDEFEARADPAGSGARPMGAGRESGSPESPAERGESDAMGEPAVLVELYGKPDCHLCDEARAIVEQIVAAEGARLVEYDITREAALMEKYGEYIPVIVVEGRQHSTWRVDAGMLARAIRAAERARGRRRWPFRPRWSRRPRP